MRHRLAVCLPAALAAIAPSGAWAHAAGPAPPADVRIPALAYDERSITLAWEKPAEHGDIVAYHVYVKGAFAGSASDNTASPAKPYLNRFAADPATPGRCGS